MTFDPLQQPKWTRRFLELARLVASWSKDPSTQVGAVIVDDLRRVIATGYNGFPRGVRDDAQRYDDRAVKYPLVVHAEANAILNAVANVRGAAMVATMMPCAECAKLIAQSGIAWVVAPKLANDRWTESHAHAKTIFVEAGVKVLELRVDETAAPAALAPLEIVSDPMTIDDARAAFAPVLAPLETAFPPYLSEVRVSIEPASDDLRVYRLNLTYKRRQVWLFVTSLGYAYEYEPAERGIVDTQEPGVAMGYLVEMLRRLQVAHNQNHTQQ